MINNSNIYAFSNQELVSFLQQVGQHDAVKVIQKYNLDGETLLAPMKYSEWEASALMRCISLIQQNPLLSVKNLKTEFSDDESVYPVDGSTELDEFEEEDLYDKCRRRDPLSTTEEESKYFTFTKKPEKVTRLPSSQYFIYSKETTSERQETVQYFQLRSNEAQPRQSTASTASYIHPNTVFLPRHEQIVVDRIKKFVNCENIVGNGQDHLYEVLVPSQVVYTEKEQNQKDEKQRKRWFVGDFIMNMCCCSCAMKIH